MKKVLCVTLEREGEALLRKMQDLGVLHPEHIKKTIESEKLTDMEHKLHVLSTVIRELENRKSEHDFQNIVPVAPRIEDVEGWIADEKRFSERISQIEREISKQLCWGDFDPEDVKRLEENGIFIQLWGMDLKRFERMIVPDGICVCVISGDKRVYFATVAWKERIKTAEAEPFELPSRGLTSLNRDVDDLNRRLAAVSGQIDSASAYIRDFKIKNARLMKERDFYETMDRAFEDESLVAFSGWIPVNDVERVEGDIKCAFKKAYIASRDPLDSETPPVKTENPWIVRTFEPLLHMLGFPKYRGPDPALFFAPFMMVFFGICLGDAGYGMIMMAAAIVMKKFLKNRISGIEFVANMCLLFGAMTTIWGILTGSIFGIAFKERGWIAMDVAPGVGDPMLLFKIAIAAGAIHLTVALALAFFNVRKLGEKLAKVGVIAVLWGGIFGVLKIPMWWILFGGGALLILLFSSDSKNPAARIGVGLWNIYGLTSLLGDVMSYARLFGLGIATGAIAAVVNVLAGDVRAAVPGLGDILAVLVLIVGHGFNFAMGIIGSLVHPARLHAVEAFPKCVQLTGVPYRPLSKQ